MIRLLFALTLLITTSLHAADQPNVLIFLADDMGWGDLSANGNPNGLTPHIDSLARDGVKLDRFYVCPVCSPTRAEFLTGRYHPRGGVKGVSTGQERLNLNERTLADAFKAAGYRTGAFGKWHNGSQWPYHPNARGFDEYYGFTSGHWGEYFDPPLEHNGQPVRGKGYITDLLTEKALSFIEAQPNRPFFCYVPYNVPHSPWAVPQEDWAPFKDKPIITSQRDAKAEKIDETRCALAMVANMDRNIGRVLQRLDDLKLADNTIVIFFTDNGPNTFRWNGDMKGKKGTTDEGGVRSPFFIRWPGKLPPGHHVTEIAAAIDILPTLCALTGVSRIGDLPLDGQDLSPLLNKTSTTWPERLIFSTWGPKISVRSQQHRLDAEGALFDMIADPEQTRDIAAAEPAIAAQLREAVNTWRREVLGVTAPGKSGPGKAGKKAATVDARPIPVGYREFPRTPLPARDGEPMGQVKRSSNAPNCSYFVHWTSTADTMSWSLDVHTEGDYEVEFVHTCPLTAVGSTLELRAGEDHLRFKLREAWDPPFYTHQDTLPRPVAESTMKEFRTLKAGVLHLRAGRHSLQLQATEMSGAALPDVRQINLILQ